MSKGQKQSNEKLHAQALCDFDNIQDAIREERQLCLEDRRFYSIAGAQWEGALSAQFENRPKFEVNKIHLSVIRIINEYRNNRISVDFQPRDDRTSDDVADLCDGLYRADEADSSADEAYDNAFEEAVGGGFGAWRLCTDYEDELDPEDERQRIRFEPIYDADKTVFFDLGAMRQDKKDAKYCFVLNPMTKQDYEDAYDDPISEWGPTIEDIQFDWGGSESDTVWVAEYYRVEETTQTLHVYEDVEGDEETYTDDELEDEDDLGVTLLDRITAQGSRKIRERKVKRRKVRKYIMSGSKILEDQGYLNGTEIPIIPVYGKRWYVDSKERCMGHVRLAKDAQRIKNMQLSKLGEVASLSSVSKPIFTSEQMLGHEEMWSEDNIKNYAYLTVNPITDAEGNAQPAGPLGYTQPAQVPPALGALLQLTETDIRDLLGNQEQGEKMQSNISGKTVELIQSRLDMQSFIYMSNMSKAIRRCGEIWLSMAKDIFVEQGRKMKTVDRQGKSHVEAIMKPAADKATGEVYYENDLSTAKLDVTVEVGPSSSSRRNATVRMLTGMMQMVTDPQDLKVLSATALMNMEGEGLSDLREYFRGMLLRMGAVKPTDDEREQLIMEQQNQQVDAQQQLMMSAAKEAEAKAQKAQADTVYQLARAKESEADTAKKKAETIETLADIALNKQRGAIDMAQTLNASAQQPGEQV